MNAVLYALCDLFEQEGVEVVTDQVRNEAGLPPRGPDGWTMEELALLERQRLDLLYRPMTPIITVDENGK